MSGSVLQRQAQLTPAQLRNRRLRNLAIGLAVAFVAVLLYAVTIAKLGPGVMTPPE
jgi:hypothetical protein